MLRNNNIGCIFPLIAAVFLLAPGGDAQAQIEAGSNRLRTRPDREFHDQINDSERLGRLIYLHDRAAANSTDALLARVGDAIGEKVAGWIEQPVRGNDILVLYYGRRGETFFPAYSVVVNSRGKATDIHQHADGDSLTAQQLSMISARELSLHQKFAACSKTYNTVILDDGVGGYYVYLLAATTQPNEMFFGGHYRLQTDGDGSSIVGFQKFTNSCLVIPRRPELKPGQTLVASLVSQILTPYPTEIHVWKSFEMDVDLYVVTIDNKAIWRVSNGKIHFVDYLDDAAGTKAQVNLPGDLALPAESKAEPDDRGVNRLCAGALARERREGACDSGARTPQPELAIPNVGRLRVDAK